MPITVFTFSGSDTLNVESGEIYINNKFNYSYSQGEVDLQQIPPPPGTKKRLLATISLNTKSSLKLIELIVEARNSNDSLNDLLDELKNYFDNFHIKNYLQINLDLPKKTIEKKLFKPSKSGKRVQDLINPRSWISRKTFLKRYNLKGYVKPIPYVNFDLNNESNNKCVYNFVVKTYPKISTKKINKYFNTNKGVEVEKIINFCSEYKIKCLLFNIDGKCIFKNEFDRNKSYASFVGIITGNHFYPIKKTENNKKSLIPRLSDNKLDCMPEDLDKQIYIKINNTYYFREGYYKADYEGKEIDTEFFKGIFPNFIYKSSDIAETIQSLTYNHENIEKEELYEIDLNKAYYTVATKKINASSFIPIFTASCIWEKYNNEEINDLYYYLFSNEALKRLKEYGFTRNTETGFMINFLIKNKLLSKDDLEYELKNSYKYPWQSILDRIKTLNEKNPKLNKEWIFYNGLLGKTININNTTIYNVDKDDGNLLNDLNQFNFIDVDTEDKDTEFYKSKTTYKYFNTKNIYNHIISQTNITLLKELLKLKKQNPKAKLLKIKVDSLGFDREIKGINKKDYKIVNETKEPYKRFINYTQFYIKGKDIINDIIDELKCFKKNKSYMGSAGTGKTYTIKGNESFDFATTTTNLCLFNMFDTEEKPTNYKTLFSVLNLYDASNYNQNMRKYKNSTIWIDEFSMVKDYMWGFIFILSKKYNVKFIISGDIKQIPPIEEKKIDLDKLFYKKVFNKIIQLTKDYRNDKKIINLRKKVEEKTEDELKPLFKKLSSKEDFYKIDTHIVAKRKYMNAINKNILEKRNLNFNLSNGDISKGVILSVNVSNKSKGIYKNDRWIVEDKLENGFLLKNYFKNYSKVFSLKEMNYFKLGFAITCHSAQGMTIKEKFAIHQIENMLNWDKDILYTAITRGTNYKNLVLYYNDQIKVDYKKVETKEKKQDLTSLDNVLYDE